MPSTTNVLDEARELVEKRLADLDDERKRLERALAELGGKADAAVAPGRPRGSARAPKQRQHQSRHRQPARRNAVNAAAAPVPTRPST